jgi:hypothetical protein
MDKQALQQFLDEHCEYRVKRSISKYKKIDKQYHEDSMEWTKKSVEKPCEDCELTVKDRIIEYKLINIGQPNQRFQKKCSECKQYLGRLLQLD